MMRTAIVGAALATCAACGTPATRPMAKTPPIEATSRSSTTSSTAVTVAPTTPVANPMLVEDCIEYTQVAAFLGDPEMTLIWNSLGLDPVALADYCAVQPPEELQRWSALLAETEASLAAAAEAATTTSPPPTTLPAPPPPTLPPAPSKTLPPAPPPSAPLPLVSIPAAKPASDCNPNYSGACVPNASDVDCAGGSGNGPAYVQGPVLVIGSDPYDLDRDGDGIGCES